MIDTTTVRVSFTGSATLSDRLGRRSFEAWLFRKFFIQAIQIALHTQLGFHFCIHPTVFRNVGWKVSSISSQFFSIYQATLYAASDDLPKHLLKQATLIPFAQACFAECRVVWNFICQFKAAEPSIGNIQLNFLH